MDYKIRAFNKQSGQIVVEYEGTWTYSIDLPITDGKFPVEEELEQVIQNIAPVYLKERKELLAQGISNAAEIEKLVVPFIEATPDVEPIANTFDVSTI